MYIYKTIFFVCIKKISERLNRSDLNFYGTLHVTPEKVYGGKIFPEKKNVFEILVETKKFAKK